MADLALSVFSAIVSGICRPALSTVSEIRRPFLRLRNDINNLEHEFHFVQTFLDVEFNQLDRVWPALLKDASLDAEDLWDEFECEELRSQVRNSFSLLHLLKFRYHLAHKVNEVRERFYEIKAHMNGPRRIERREGESLMTSSMSADYDSYYFVRDSDVIGRTIDREKIIALLMNPVENSRVPVILLCGIRGMGKTTLALLVYNDRTVSLVFNLKIWVCVSGGFNFPKIISKIVKSATGGENVEDLHIEELAAQLFQNLKGKKFLLILDGLCDEKPDGWMELMNLLMVGEKGSKIIVTACGNSNSIAFSLGAVSTYTLEGLSHEDCLSLFVRYAFRGEEKRPEKLMDISKQIVEKCEGVPLTVKNLGSLLISKLDERDWEYVRDTEIWKLKQKEDHILSHLEQSFYELPPHLRQCFLYCSLFPKDTKIYSFELIQLWMAHGVLQSHGERDLEDVGEHYFEDLRSRSFFGDVNEEFSFSSFYAKDLALLVAQRFGEFSIVSSSTMAVPERVRHVSITYGGGEIPASIDRLRNMRTILFPLCGVGPVGSTFIEQVILKFKRLRMLDISDSSFETLPSYISRLKHLRYLDLSRNVRIEKLPNSLCKLQSLQTLKLVGCTKLGGLPRDTKNLISLRHLGITTTETYFSKNGIECLTSLQTLNIASSGFLISLPISMEYLSELKIFVINGCEKLSLNEGEDVEIPSLRFQTLIFENLPGMVAFPRWLQGCQYTLRYLCVRHCPNLTGLPIWLTSTASLKKIEIFGCPQLRSLPNGIHCLPSLQGISIFGCPILRDFVNTMSKDWLHKIHFVDDC